MNALIKRDWVEDYRDLYDSVELSYYCEKNFFTDENVAKHIDALSDKLRPTNFIPTWEDFYMEYCEEMAEVATEIISMLCENDECVIQQLSAVKNYDERESFLCDLESELFEEWSYSGHTYHDNLLVLSSVLRGKCVMLTYEDSLNHGNINLDIPSHLVISVGDAQNALFPQFVRKANDMVFENLYSGEEAENVDLRCVVLRKQNDNLKIGGEVKWAQ